VVRSCGICVISNDHLEAHGPKPSCVQRLAEPANSQLEDLLAGGASCICSPAAEEDVPVMALGGRRRKAGQSGRALRANPDAPPAAPSCLSPTRPPYALATAASRRRLAARSLSWVLTWRACVACVNCVWVRLRSDLRSSLILSMYCEKKRVLCERSAVRCAVNQG
jgi:hypothetical protein